MKRILATLVLLSACNNPIEPTKVYPPPMYIPNDTDKIIPAFTIDCDRNRVCLFDAVASKSNDLPIEWFGWSFGDASVRVMPASIPSVQHTYKNSGTYTVMLTVWDTKERGARLYKTFTVE